MDVGRARIWLGRFAGRHYALALRLWGIALGLAALLAIPWRAWGVWGREAGGRLLGLAVPLDLAARDLLLSLVAVWILLLVLLPTCSAWYSWCFRYVAWMAARVLGRLRAWIVRSLLLALLLALVYWQREALKHFGALLLSPKAPWLPLLGKGLLALLLMALVAGTLRARKALVILPFRDFTGDSTLASTIQGLAAALRSDLARIARIYQTLDEAWSRPQGEGRDLALRVEPVDSSLQSAVTPDSKISLGFVQIPIGPIMAALANLGRGSRLAVGVHRLAGDLILIAELQGGERERSWKVVPEMPEDAEKPAPGLSPLAPLLQQLAYRLAAELAPIGSPHWRAARDYTDGLDTYRSTQHTQRDRTLLLRQAEQCFLRALNEDNRFAQCHYNLGIVYGELGQPASALFELHRALEEGHVASLFALASTYFGEGRYDEAIQFCDEALRKEPWRAETWKLKALALRGRRTRQLGRVPEPDDEEWRSVLEHRETAAALAWRSLCSSRLAGNRGEGELKMAALCLVDLAVAYAQVSRFRRSARLLNQSLHLRPDDPKPRFELGKVLTAADRWRAALATLENATVDERNVHDAAVRWLCMLGASLALSEQTGESAFQTVSQFAFLRLLDCSAADPVETQRAFQEGYVDRRKVDLTEYQLRLNAGNAFADLVKAVPAGSPERLEALEAAVAGLRRQEGEEAGAFLARLRSGPSGAPEREPWRQLWADWAALLPAPGAPLPESAEAGLKAIEADWDWAIAQLEIRRADLAQDASVRAGALTEAIARLQSHGFSQIRREGLHGHLAQAYFAAAEPAGPERQTHLGSALLHAQQAVAGDPENVWERSLLGDIYAALADSRRAEAEWLTCLDLDPEDPWTVRSIAKLYWNLGVFTSSPEHRRSAFQRVIKLLDRALSLQASRRFEDAPRDLEALGWLHFWLGLFHAELLHFDEGIRHQRVALALGFKPIEAQLTLGMTYHEARAYDQAERELRAGVAEAYRRSRGRQTSVPAQAPGEESPINEILLQIYLEQALLLAELGVDLARAGRRVAAARRRLDLLKYAHRPAQVEVQGKDPRFLKSEYHRVASRLSLARGDVAKSLEECERALAFAPRSEVWLLLVRICLTAGRDGGMDPEAARERIEDALGRARDSDLRGLFTGELAELERRRALLDLSARR